MSKLKNLLDKSIKKIESSVDSYLKVTIGVMLLASGFLGVRIYNNSQPNITASTVMITNVEGNSGGSGVVISTTNNESKILTNRHVCEVATNGGKVTSTNGESHLIKSMYKSNQHDMCMIIVAGNFKHKVNLASSSPELYSDAIISGHPNLLPNVVSKGHFSGNQIIQVMMGFRDCTAEEASDDKLSLVCMFFGGLPIIKTFEAVLATAMIMPGSSGSAVYNSDKELSGLVFAGSGGMSYAYIVPYEYVSSFVNEEVYELKAEVPNYVIDIKKLLENSRKKRIKEKEIETKCETATDPQISKYCDVILRDINWRKNY